LGNDAAKPAVS
jgi:hypothetical protein